MCVSYPLASFLPSSSSIFSSSSSLPSTSTLSTYRVINDDASIVTGECLGVFECEVSRHRQKDDIAFSCLVNVKEFHGDGSVLVGVHFGSGTAFTAEDAECRYGKVALFEALPNFLADGARGTDNSDGILHHVQSSAAGSATGGAAAKARVTCVTWESMCVYVCMCVCMCVFEFVVSRKGVNSQGSIGARDKGEGGFV